MKSQITPVFRGDSFIVNEEKIRFLEKLGEVPSEEEPIKIINLYENESFMRETLRKNCRIAVKYKVGDTSFTSYIINISVHGVFIENNDRFPIGQPIRMTFKVPNAPDRLDLKGKINRSGLRGIGVNFLDLNQDQQEIIRTYSVNH